MTKEQRRDVQWQKDNVQFMGELILGHLRYGTHGLNSVKNCHPFIRKAIGSTGRWS
ncbi:MAG: hypothetical protein R2825_03740 [Saprospiraceae bacterium]